jgi:dolichyl-diphosphooligosaccharide--protein glycosyltransferase
MPLQKPRGRKQQSHKKAYALITIAVLVAAVAATYAYVNGYFPGAGSSSTTKTASTCGASYVSVNGTVYARINTSKGSFNIALFCDAAPHTVTNFVSLSKSGFYTDLTWHRIVPGFVIQTGDPDTVNGGGTRKDWGYNSSTVSVPFEYNSTLHNYRGYLAMASTNRGVGGSSQFFINLNDSNANTQGGPQLDGGYAVFGKVLGSGMSVIDAIAAVPVYGQTSPYYSQPIDPSQALLLSVTILSGPP